jgi:hypothetical protein
MSFGYNSILFSAVIYQIGVYLDQIFYNNIIILQLPQQYTDSIYILTMDVTMLCFDYLKCYSLVSKNSIQNSQNLRRCFCLHFRDILIIFLETYPTLFWLYLFLTFCILVFIYSSLFSKSYLWDTWITVGKEITIPLYIQFSKYNVNTYFITLTILYLFIWVQCKAKYFYSLLLTMKVPS